MGNTGSRGGGNGSGSPGLVGIRRRNSSRRQNHHRQPPAFGPAPAPPIPPDQQQPPPEVTANRYVFAAATPYPPQYPNPNPPQYPNPNPPQYFQYGYYPPPPPAMPAPLPAPFDHHHRGEYPGSQPGWVVGGRYPPYGPPQPPPPYVEHQKAVTIRNDVNIKKETLKVVPDEQNPGGFLVAFTFDATVAGSVTVFFFAKEGINCAMAATKDLLEPVTVSFVEGLGQKFRQPSGTGINFSTYDDTELLKEGELDIYPLAVKAEASPSSNQGTADENQKLGTPNSQITQAIFEKKDNGEYHVRVVKQILWVNQTRYELQEIYGIGNSVENDTDGNDPGKECVICLSEPRDTTVLPCRHMCMCSECAKVHRLQSNRCPICRQPVERLLEIKVNNKGEQQQEHATEQADPHVHRG